MRAAPRVFLWYLLVALLLPFLADRPEAQQTSIVVVREYDVDALRVIDGEDGLGVVWDGLDATVRPGSPALPVDHVTVEAPAGMRLVEVRTRVEGERVLPLSGTLEPYRGGPGSRDEAVLPDPAVYSSPGPFPDAVTETQAGGYFRGRRLETVDVHPARYLPGDGSLRICATVTLEFVFGPDSDRDHVVPRPVAWVGGDRFAEARNRVAMPSPLSAGARTEANVPLVAGGEPFSPRFLPSEDGSPVRFLIITTPELEPAFQVLADWRTALGVPTVVRTDSLIYAEYPRGVDHAEDIRNFLREAVGQWGVEYVLLAGDAGVLPIRYGKSYFFGGELIPTDLYFMCLDRNWNANGDEYFGNGYVNSTYPGDSVDLYPELWLGRASVRNVAEADVFVQKIINYETAVSTDPGFTDRVLMLGEVLFPQNWSDGDSVIFDGAHLCETASGLLNGTVDHLRMYENFESYPGSVVEHRSAVIAEINRGYNLVLHVGHGYRNTMAVGLNGEALSNADADGFYNKYRQGLLYAINCTSSAFDFDCIAEHFLRNPWGGAVSTVGSTRYDFPATGWNYQDEFFDLVFHQGVSRIGEAAALQKVPFIPSARSDGEHRWTQFSLIHMGDPTLDLYTAPVDTLSAVLHDPLELGRGLYAVSVVNSSGPVEGAVVTLNKSDDSFASGLTDAAGQVTLQFRPDFPGGLTLGVSAHNHLARVDSLQVTATVLPHLFVQDVIVDDGFGGDGDSLLEAGETALLYLEIGNQGGGTADGVTVQLTTAPAGVTVLDAAAACPSVLPDSFAVCADPLEVSLAPGLADLSVLVLGASLEADLYSIDDEFLLYAGAPRLELDVTAVRDTTGNGDGDGVLEPGEDQHLRVYVRNLGLGRAAGVTGSLSSSDPVVQVLDGACAYGDLEPGEAGGGNGFLVNVADGDASRSVWLTVTDQSGVVIDQRLDLEPPARPVGLVADGGSVSIDLRWVPLTVDDLAGYHVYSSLSPGGPFTRVNHRRTEPISYYRSEDLPPLTRFYFRVAAVDSSGNEGPLSGVAEATTSLVGHENFPMELSAATSSAPCLAYLSGDTKAEVVTGADEIYVALHDGIEYLDGDNDTRTYGVFSSSGFGPFWSPPAVGDLEHDGIQEIVGATWESSLLYVWNSHGGTRPGWPKSLTVGGTLSRYVWSAPALADVDGDGDLEIFINAGRYTFGFHHDGTEVADGDHNGLTEGVFLVMAASANYGSPAIADVDQDGQPEIIVGSRDGNLYVLNADATHVPGFPYAAGGDITNSPAVADLDNDGWKEIVFATSAYQVFALNANLQQPPGWPTAANMNRDYDASPALADMDGDGFLDVILCAGNGTVYMWHGQDGQKFPGWGFVIYDANGQKVGLSSSPAVGNLDGDPEYEVCFGGADGNLYAYNVDASLVAGFPIGTDNVIEGGPLLWDIDDDGFTEVVAHSYDEHIYVWKSPGAFDPDNQPWPMFRRNSRRTGETESPIWEVTGVPGDAPPAVGLTLSSGFPNPFAARTTITYELPAAEGRDVPVELRVFDTNGRRVATLADGPQAAGLHTVTWDGRSSDGRRVSAGVYFYQLRAAGRALTRKLVLLP